MAAGDRKEINRTGHIFLTIGLSVCCISQLFTSDEDNLLKPLFFCHSVFVIFIQIRVLFSLFL